LLTALGTGAATLTVRVNEPLATASPTPLRLSSGLALVMLAPAETSEAIPVDIQ
jgi:hypothetical protein